MMMEKPERVAEGSRAPDFDLKSNTGDRVTLAKFHGEAHVALFFVREYA